MQVSEARQNDFQVSTFDYVSLRGIFFSQLGKTSREGDFSDFANKHPKRLVTSGVFAKEFWSSPKMKAKWKNNGLTAEQAWFGIRSIIKGSMVFFEYTQEHKGDLKRGYELPEDVWKKIHGNPPRGFSSSQLTDLVVVFNAYESWKRARGWKDEMDLVRQAYLETKHLVSFVTRPTSESQKLETLAQWIYDEFRTKYMRVGPVIEKSQATKARKDASPDVVRGIAKWKEKVKTHIDDGSDIYDFLSAIPLRPTTVGGIKFPVFKYKFSKSWRVFYTLQDRPHPIKDGYEMIVWVLTYSHTDDQGKALAAALHDFDGDISELLEEVDYKTEAPTGNFRDHEIPGRGPPKPLDRFDETPTGMDATDHDGNIILDEQQLAAILKSQPLLIDGLPGTGKTSAVAKRAGIVTAAKTKKRVLITCYNPSVLDRMRQDIQYSLDHDFAQTRAEAKNENKWQLLPHATQAMHYVFDSNQAEKSTSMANSWHFSESGAFENDEWGYNEIIVDECQDLTELEFEFLRKFAMKEYGLDQETHEEYSGDPRRFTLAGDPLQTLEPTGFNWGRFMAFLYTSRNVREAIPRGDLKVEQFLKNYRSVGEITTLANAADLRRSKVLTSDIEQRNMTSSKGKSNPPKKPLITSINGKKDIHTAAQFYSKGAETNAEILTWSNDSNDVTRLLREGGDQDEILSLAFDLVSKENSDSDKKFGVEDWDKTGLLLHTQRSIKGLEFDTVVLHRIFSDRNVRKRLVSMTIQGDPIDDELDDYRKKYASDDYSGERIEIAFAFSRLYVSLTRAKINLHLFEDESGIDFLKEMTIGIEGEGDSPEYGLDLFEFDPALSIDDTIVREEFNPSPEQLYKRFLTYRRLWREVREIRYATFAIEIAEKNNLFKDRHSGPISRREVDEIRAEMQQHLGDQVDDPGQKAEHYRKATNHFQDASMAHRAAPIIFGIPDALRNKEDLKKCLELMELSEPSPQLSLLIYYTQLLLKEKTTKEAKDVLDPVPDANEYWSQEVIVQAVSRAREEQLSETAKTWPDDKEYLRETNAGIFQPDLGKLFSLLESKGEYPLILDLMPGRDEKKKYSEFHIRALVDQSKDYSLKERQEEVSGNLASFAGYDASSLAPARQQLIADHLSLIDEPEKVYPKQVVMLSTMEKFPGKFYPFNHYYASNDWQERVIASMREIANVLSAAQDSSDETHLDYTVITERTRLWCQAVRHAHSGADDSNRRTINELMKVMLAKKKTVPQNLEFVNDDSIAASWTKSQFERIPPRDLDEGIIRKMGKAAPKLEPKLNLDLLIHYIPRMFDQLPSGDSDGGSRKEIFKLFGDGILRELFKLSSLGHRLQDGEGGYRQDRLVSRMRIITEILLWPEKKYDPKLFNDWLSHADFEQPPNQRLVKNVTLLKITKFEKDNEEFFKIVSKNEKKFDTKWNSTALSYCELIGKIDQGKASRLNERISRDLGEEVKELIQNARDFPTAIDMVETHLKKTRTNWEWQGPQLSALLVKKDALSDLPEFPRKEWDLNVRESEKDLGWFYKALSEENLTSPDRETMFRNLFQICPTSILLKSALEGDETVWEDARETMDKLMNNSLDKISQKIRDIAMARSGGKKGIPEDQKKVHRNDLSAIRALQDDLIEPDYPIMNSSLALLLISSRMSDGGAESTAKQLGLSEKGSNPDILRRIANRFSTHDTKVAWTDRDKNDHENTISEILIGIFTTNSKNKGFFKIFD